MRGCLAERTRAGYFFENFNRTTQSSRVHEAYTRFENGQIHWHDLVLICFRKMFNHCAHHGEVRVRPFEKSTHIFLQDRSWCYRWNEHLSSDASWLRRNLADCLSCLNGGITTPMCGGWTLACIQSEIVNTSPLTSEQDCAHDRHRAG